MIFLQLLLKRLGNYFLKNTAGDFDLDAGLEIISIDQTKVIVKILDSFLTTHLQLKYLELNFKSNFFEINADKNNRIRLSIIEDDSIENSIPKTKIVFNTYENISLTHDLFYVVDYKNLSGNELFSSVMGYFEQRSN